MEDTISTNSLRKETLKKIEFTVYGNPIPWKRARRKGDQYYIARDVMEHQAEVIAVFLEKYSLLPFPVFPEGELVLTLKFYRADRRRVDLSNLEKLVEDALTEYVWKDDSQVARRGEGSGRYYDKDNSRTEVEVWEIDD